MSIRKNWRTTLLVLLITVTFTSVIGGTMAWFTDTVTSSTNVIEAGTLQVGLNFADTANPTEWKDAEGAAPIFNYKLWEPGYTSLKYVQVVNKGNLAFKYQVQIVPTPSTEETTTANLAEVIDVYYCVVDSSFIAPQSAADVKGWQHAGTLDELATNPEKAMTGVMLGGQQPMTIAIALHMQETAGNKYQGATVGEGFAIKLVATQYTKESDSFNDQYDAGATFVELPVAGVEEMDTTERSGLMLKTYGQFSPANVPTELKNEDDTLTLDYGLTFQATESLADLESKPYKKWNADFVVSSNKAVTTEDIDKYGAPLVLAGEYGSFGWVPVPVTFEVEANSQNRLLQPFGTFTYKDVLEFVGTFNCGIKANPEWATPGTTITVELKVWETDAEGNEVAEYTVAAYSYTY